MDRNQLFPLEKVKSMVDLGVRFETVSPLGIIFQKKLTKLTAF